jgi:hypothetical protein
MRILGYNFDADPDTDPDLLFDADPDFFSADADPGYQNDADP